MIQDISNINIYAKVQVEEGWGKVCFLSRTKETMMVNLTPKKTNLTLIKMTFLFSVTPSSLAIPTIPEILELPFCMKYQQWEHIVVE